MIEAMSDDEDVCPILTIYLETKNYSDDELDDGFELDDSHNPLEENLGVKVERKIDTDPLNLAKKWSSSDDADIAKTCEESKILKINDETDQVAATTVAIAAVAASKGMSRFLEKIRQNQLCYMRNVDGSVFGPCLICDTELTLTWEEWKRHLLNHTGEQNFYCFGCNFFMPERVAHGICTLDSITDTFDTEQNGPLYGWACKRCDNYVKIHHYQMVMGHSDAEHNGQCSFNDAEMVILLPDLRPCHKIISPSLNLLQSEDDKSLLYVPLNMQYKCGAETCSFQGRTIVEYMEHFCNEHSQCNKFNCPHCNKTIVSNDTTIVAASEASETSETPKAAQHQTILPIDVFHHIQLHGRYIHQCFWCGFKTPFQFAIRAHVTDEHSEFELKYWRNIRSGIYETKVYLTKSWFVCSICNECINTTSSAFDHFNNEHPEYDVDFKMIEEIKITMSDQTVKWSKKDLGEHYRQMFTCEHGSCGQDFPNEHTWLDHFSQTHPSQPLAVKRVFKWLEGSNYETAQAETYNNDIEINDSSNDEISESNRKNPSTINSQNIESVATVTEPCSSVQKIDKRSKTNKTLKQSCSKQIIQCNVCGYRTKYTSHLKTHMRVHTGERPFSCDHCEYKFTTKQNLCRHIKRVSKRNESIPINRRPPIPI